MIDILRVASWLGILAVVFIPLERVFGVRSQRVLRQGIGTDLCYYFLSSLLPGLLLAAPLGVLAWCAHRAVPASLHAATAALPLWATVLFSLVASEAGYYWYHRMSHTVPFLWRFHSIHHSASEVDFLVNTRAHPVDMMLGRFCGLAPLYLLGVGGPLGTSGSVVPTVVALTGMVWSFFIHANLRWRFGPLEWLVSTPAFHHWHHTLAASGTCNYASTLPVLDRIFGTYRLPRSDWPARYGIDAVLPNSLAAQLAYPFSPVSAPGRAMPTRSHPASHRRRRNCDALCNDRPYLAQGTHRQYGPSRPVIRE